MIRLKIDTEKISVQSTPKPLVRLGNSVNRINVASTILAKPVVKPFVPTISRIETIYHQIERAKDLIIQIKQSSVPPSTPEPPTPPIPPLRTQTNTSGYNEPDKNSFINTTIVATKLENDDGIRKQQPEIIISTNFLPLFDNDGKKTDAGKLLDAYSQFRYLKYINSVDIISQISKNDESFGQNLQNLAGTLANKIGLLQTDITAILTYINQLELFKSKFDLRNDSFYGVDVSDFSKDKKDDLIQHENKDRYWNQLTPNHEKLNIKSIYDILGYDTQDLSIYSATKVWDQLLIEIKNLLKYHSKNLIDIPNKSTDSHPADYSIVKSDSYFQFDNSKIKNVIVVDELLNIAPKDNLVSTVEDNLVSAVNNITDILTILHSFPLKSETDKVCCLVNFLSKELLYSSRLGEQTFIVSQDEGRQTNYLQNSLNKFNYRVSETENNWGMFDAIFGNFGSNIFEFSNNNINNITHKIITENNVTKKILTFEQPDYSITDKDKNITSGIDFYVENIINVTNSQTELNTQNISVLRDQIKNYKDYLNDTIKNCNLYRLMQSSDWINGKQSPELLYLCNPDGFFDTLKTQLFENIQTNCLTSIDTAINNRPSIDLAIIALLEKAINNKKLLSLFVLYFHMINKNKTNMVGFITDKIVSTIKDDLKTMSSTPDKNPYKFDFVTITNSLKTGSRVKIIEIISKFINFLFTRFEQYFAIQNKKTKYSGYYDTVILTAIVDLTIRSIVEYFGVKISGKIKFNNDYHEYMFSYNKPSPADIAVPDDARIEESNRRLNVITNIKDKLIKEITIIRSSISFLVNALSQLEIELGKQIDKSKSIKSNLDSIKKNYQSKVDIKELLSEQQLLTLLNNLRAYNEIVGLPQPSTDSLGKPALKELKTDSAIWDNDITIINTTPVIIDDSLILPKLKNAIYHTFKGEKYKSLEGNNKKILSIGIPNKFLKNLQRSYVVTAKNKTEVYNLERDLIKINIYKKDNLYPDLLWKPKTFLFELSRFTDKYSKFYNDKLADDNSIITFDDIVKYIGTLNYEDINRIGKRFYFGDNWSSAYKFLSDVEKTNLYNNHIMSFLLEKYIHLLTGFSINENSFFIDSNKEGATFSKKIDDNLFERLIDNYVTLITNQNSSPILSKDISNKLFGGNFSPENKKMEDVKSNIAISAINSQDVLNKVSEANYDNIMYGIRNLYELSLLNSSISDPEKIIPILLEPKKYERIYNVIVDPDEYELDYSTTIKHSDGTINKVNLELVKSLISKGVLIDKSPEENNETNKIYLQSSKTENSTYFDSYFAAIEAYTRNE